MIKQSSSSLKKSKQLVLARCYLKAVLLSAMLPTVSNNFENTHQFLSTIPYFNHTLYCKSSCST